MLWVSRSICSGFILPVSRSRGIVPKTDFAASRLLVRRLKRAPAGAGERQCKPEGRAPPFLAIHADTSTMLVDDAFGDSKTQAAAAFDPAVRHPRLLESVEHPAAKLFGYSRTLIANTDFYLSIGWFDEYLDRTSSGRKLESVTQQIDHHLHDVVRVHPHVDELGICLDFNWYTFLGRQGRKRLHRSFDHLVESDDVIKHSQAPRLYFVDIEQAVDHFDQPVH